MWYIKKIACVKQLEWSGGLAVGQHKKIYWKYKDLYFFKNSKFVFYFEINCKDNCNFIFYC